MTKTELVKKFLSNNCNEEEARLAMQHLEADPSLLEEMLSKSEWDEVDTLLPMSPVIEGEMRKRVAFKTARPLIGTMKPALAYAAVLSAAIACLFFLLSGERETVHSKITVATPVLPSTKTVHNSSSSIQNLTLADGSAIRIYPGSSIEYQVNFNENRTIKLYGKATFNVTKNAASPFVVHSGKITTTALGTRFLVDNNDYPNKVNVKLFEGRVVVKPIDSNILLQATFLEAGQQCFVDMDNMLVKVTPMVSPRLIAAKHKPVVHSQSQNQDQLLTFSKTPLSDVLEKLQQIYKQRIDFNTDDIDEKYFTGEFSVKDSLSTVLKMIAVMNELDMRADSEVIQMRKRARSDDDGNNAMAHDKDTATGQRTSFSAIDLWKITPPPSPQKQIHASQEVQEKVTVEENAIRYAGISLNELLPLLQKQTKKKIYYEAEALQHINFTGSVPFDQSLRKLLFVICNSNGLTLTVDKRSYHINKAQ